MSGDIGGGYLDSGLSFACFLVCLDIRSTYLDKGGRLSTLS